ncbi:MAG: c-type cytochrome [Sulfurovum sp.]|nr:c-type cytochrome [Sulfurovum sp.]
MKKVAIAMLFGACTLLLADGAALYAKCAGCHGKDGKTKALGKSPSIAGLAVDTLVKDMEGYKAGTLNKSGMGGVMKGQVVSYTPEQIKEVAEYISKLPK